MKTVFTFLALCSMLSLHAQSSDILILKKKNRTLRTFFPATEMEFNTAAKNYDAVIQSINRDSIFLVQYDIRQVPTTLGVYIMDTVGTYPFAVNYKEIVGFGKDKNRRFDWSGSGGALFGGGILLTTIGLGTWIFTKSNNQYHASPYLIGGAALLAGIGYLLGKTNSKELILGKKYSLEYIPVK